MHYARSKTHFLLKGLVFGHDGRAMSPWHSVKKNGRKYRYYVPQRDLKEGAGTSGLPRIPAGELEAAVLHQLQTCLSSCQLNHEITVRAKSLDPELDEAKVTVALMQFGQVWDQLFPAEQSRMVNLLVERITVSNTDMTSAYATTASINWLRS
jgi:site-specific DNA recombinase